MAILQSNGAAPAENGDACHGSESDDVGPSLMLSSSVSSDIDSGMESDEPDITSFLEPGSELCQIGNQTIALPVELYELPNLGEILSIDTWNNILNDSDRLELAQYLPDMDQETFMQTLSELFGGKNFNFGSPLSDFFKLLSSGQCDPRVALLCTGLDFAEKRRYYCNLRRYHDSMLGRILGMKESWQNCEGYGLEEKIRFLNIMRNQESLGNESDQNTELELEPQSESQPESESESESESELQNTDSDDTIRRDYLNGGSRDNYGSFRAGSTNGFPRRRNRDLGFVQNEKVAIKSRKLRFGEEEEDQEVTAVSQKYRGKAKGAFKSRSTVKPNKNSLSSSDLRARGSEGKGANKKPCNNESKNSRAEVTGLPNKCEDNESDLSQKGAVVEPVFDSDKPKKKSKNKKAVVEPVFDSDKPKKKSKNKKAVVEPVFDSDKPKKKSKNKKVVVEPVLDSEKPKKKINSKKTALSAEVQVDPIKGKAGQTKGRKVEKKRKSVVTPGPSEHTNTDLSFNNENIVSEQVEGNEDKLVGVQLVEVPVLQETETPIKKQKRKPPAVNGESSTKKRKREKIDMDKVKTGSAPQSDSVTASKKKRGRKKVESALDAEAAVPIEPVKQEEAAPVSEPVKPPKKAYVPITPTVHTGFSFSIVHLLSAIRKVMVKVDMKADVLPISANLQVDDHESVQIEEPANTQFPSSPSLTLMEIVEGVKLDPLDTSVLEAPVRLNELIRGALRIFSSKHAPLGAKAWKPLVSYTSSNKSWSWAGPVVKPTDDITIDEQTSPDMWGLPQKSVVKLVDSFANWLRQGEEILQRISSLPPPPVPIHANLEEKDRFKEIKSLKSQNTICPCTDEVRFFFHMEETIRYSIPDRAFIYTATDGRKSTVAPLGRGGGKKMSTKARDHFMLKPDRPPHVTILGLVRDAASRLPGSIGTRADVCTLIRDSQYVVEDVADDKVSEVVSGALDRLHYEQDPCVKFDSERKLWVYLHREREEEDFEDEGTSSTKKWKKPKKEAPENTQIEAVNNGEANNINTGMLQVEGNFVNTDASEVLRPFGDLNLLYGENPFVCQPGQENLFACQQGQENLFVSQAVSSNGFPCQLVQENPFECQPGQGNPFVSQAVPSNSVLAEQFVDGRPLGFFDTTLL